MFKLKLLIAKILPKKLLKVSKSNYRKFRGLVFNQIYKGKEVYCPCCNRNFSRFMPFKYEKGFNNDERFKYTFKNTTCPFCYSMPRHRIVCFYFNQIKGTLKQYSFPILMIGAEHAIELWLKQNNIPFTTADLYDKTADIELDIQQMPFQDKTWSLIICNHVLEHVPNFEKSMKELKRVLKDDGIIEISSPTDKTLSSMIEDTTTISHEERIQKFGQFDHMRIFGKDFNKQIENTGFLAELIKGDELPFNIGGVVGPANYDDNTIYICRKKIS